MGDTRGHPHQTPPTYWLKLTSAGFVGYMFDDGNEDGRIGLQKRFLEPSFAASLINATLRSLRDVINRMKNGLDNN